MNTTHSPLPWTVEHPFGEPGCFISSSNPRTTNPLVAQLVSHSGEHEANARFIITACNSHAALLGALERLLKLCEDGEGNDIYGQEQARQAITLAKGVQS